MAGVRRFCVDLVVKVYCFVWYCYLYAVDAFGALVWLRCFVVLGLLFYDLLYCWVCLLDLVGELMIWVCLLWFIIWFWFICLLWCLLLDYDYWFWVFLVLICNSVAWFCLILFYVLVVVLGVIELIVLWICLLVLVLMFVVDYFVDYLSFCCFLLVVGSVIWLWLFCLLNVCCCFGFDVEVFGLLFYLRFFSFCFIRFWFGFLVC